MTKIIGITGLAGAGKDSFASQLQRALTINGFESRIDSFADPIRKISQRMGLEPYDRERKEVKHAMGPDDFNDRLYEAIEAVLAERLEDNDRALLYAYTVEACDRFIIDRDATYPTMHISPREFMQVLGTEGGQRIRKGLWVDSALMRWRSMPGYTLVADCRFEYEIRQIDHLFVVVRPGVVRVNEHASEDLPDRLTKGLRPAFVQLDKLHYIENDGGLSDLATLASDAAVLI
ncbi:hypothetical protein KZJ38_07485 [Paraburkholderia edwinii]|uniref:DNMP kinase n=1 Tax=Paraburkholderia edwinii TaxID=2861782 RepID=A0ABX8UMC2_9BURK|nr:hypothetical protein [Paraburkholderia edwinii]QYD70140.1 hypothetical protein KZJ38_07485 [Paraburkholderia edwinii]